MQNEKRGKRIKNNSKTATIQLSASSHQFTQEQGEIMPHPIDNPIKIVPSNIFAVRYLVLDLRIGLKGCQERFDCLNKDTTNPIPVEFLKDRITELKEKTDLLYECYDKLMDETLHNELVVIMRQGGLRDYNTKLCIVR